MDNTISKDIKTKLDELTSIKEGLKKTINNKLGGNIGNNTKFQEYSKIIDNFECPLPEELYLLQLTTDNGGGIVYIGDDKSISSGLYLPNTNLSITAVPIENHSEFLNWEEIIDGNVINTFSIEKIDIEIKNNVTYKACFKINEIPDEPVDPEVPTLNDPWYFWSGSDINNSHIQNELNNLYEKGGIKVINYVYNNTIYQYNIFMIPSYTSIDITLKTSDEYITLLMKQDFEDITDEKYKDLYDDLPTDLVSLGYKFYILSFGVSVLSDNSELIIKCVEDK